MRSQSALSIGLALFLLCNVAKPVAASKGSGSATALFAIENRAEAMAEGETKGAAARKAGQEIAAMWPVARAALVHLGAPATRLRAADVAVNALARDMRAGHDSRRSANEVTGTLGSLFAIAGEKVPSEVHHLDYLGRSIALDVQAHVLQRAKADATALTLTWSRLRPLAVSRPSASVAIAAYDSAAVHVRDAAKRGDERALLAAAIKSTDALDRLEKLWR